jgi:hypothetical protein
VAELTALFDDEDDALTRQEAAAQYQGPSTAELRDFSNKLQKETLRAPLTQRLLGSSGSSSGSSSGISSGSSGHGGDGAVFAGLPLGDGGGRARLPGLPALSLGLPGGSRPASLQRTASFLPGAPAAAVIVPTLDLSFGSSCRDALAGGRGESNGGTSSSGAGGEKKEGADYLRRPSLPAAGSKFSSRMKATLGDAQEALLSARDDDYHLTGDDDDERFFR